MKFVWDEAKNSRNIKKHGISFEEASLVFAEADCLEIFDEAHSYEEDRFIAIGPISRGVVVVISTEHDRDIVRIISARFATSRETELYRQHLGGRLR